MSNTLQGVVIIFLVKAWTRMMKRLSNSFAFPLGKGANGRKNYFWKINKRGNNSHYDSSSSCSLFIVSLKVTDTLYIIL